MKLSHCTFIFTLLLLHLFTSCQAELEIELGEITGGTSYSLQFTDGGYLYSDATYASNCKEYLDSDAYADEDSGIYWIKPGITPFKVYCDMTMAGGGWTVVIANGDNSDNETIDSCILRFGTDASYICGTPEIDTDYVADVRDLTYQEIAFTTIDNSDQISGQAYMSWNTLQTFSTTTLKFSIAPDTNGLDLGNGATQIGCRTNIVQSIGNHTISADRGGHASGTIVFMMGTDGADLLSDFNVLDSQIQNQGKASQALMTYKTAKVVKITSSR